MNDSTLPVFEDVVSLDDALVQNRLARAPDALIAAALDRAPIPVRLKIVQNLSARRRESVERISEVFSDRSRTVGRRVLVSLLWGLPDPEAEAALGAAAPAAAGKVDWPRLLDHLARCNPALAEARERRRRAIEAALVRTVLSERGC